MDQKDWKAEIATALEAQLRDAEPAQATTCEQQLLDDLRDYGRQVAMDAVGAALDFGRKYLRCRFGGDTPEARAAFGDFASILSQCALSHWRLLLGGNWAAYTTAVFQCVIDNLLGNK